MNFDKIFDKLYEQKSREKEALFFFFMMIMPLQYNLHFQSVHVDIYTVYQMHSTIKWNGRLQEAP